MSNPRTPRSDRAKSPDQPKAGKCQQKTKHNEKRDERARPTSDQKLKPAEFAKDRSGKRAPTRGRGTGQSRNQTDTRESQDKPATSRSDENPASKPHQQSKKLSGRDEPTQTSESKSAEQRTPRSARAHKSGSNNTNQTGETKAPKNDAQASAKQTDSRRSQGEAQKAPKGNQDEKPAPKRANNDRQSQKQTDSRDDPSELSSGKTEHFRQHATDEQDKVLHATIEKLKIKTCERSAASSCVNKITEKVVSHLKQNTTWCADIEHLTTGSYYENVKICEPDEFDVMLTVPVGRVDIQNFPGKEAFYSVALKRHPTKHFLAKFLNEDKTIKASEMLNEFRNGVKEALDVKAVDLLSYKIVVQRKKQKCPAVTIQVTENGKEIYLDFVLGLKVHGHWPDNTQNGFKIEHWLGTKEKRELKCQPYYLVPKYEGKGNEEHDGVDAKNAWRISFSHVEKYILKKHGNSKTCCEANGQKCCRKECLKLLKYLLSQLKEMHSEKMSKFCSYHAKTTLLHACVQRPEDSMWACSQLTDCFWQLLDDFVTFLKTQALPNFFVPSHNLLNTDSVPKSSCNFLAEQIEFQWENNFPIFQLL